MRTTRGRRACPAAASKGGAVFESRLDDLCSNTQRRCLESKRPGKKMRDFLVYIAYIFCKQMNDPTFFPVARRNNPDRSAWTQEPDVCKCNERSYLGLLNSLTLTCTCKQKILSVVSNRTLTFGINLLTFSRSFPFPRSFPFLHYGSHDKTTR